MNKVLISVMLAIAILGGCRNRGTQHVDVPSGFDGGVLLQRQSNLSSLISPAELASIIGKKPEVIKRYRKMYDPDPSRHASVFSWPSGNKIAIGDDGEQIESYHAVSMGYVRNMSRDEFEQRYGQGLAAKLDINALAQNPEIDADIAREEAAYLANEAQSVHYERIDDIGVPAYWELPRQAMHLHLGDISFTITVNTEENERKSQKMALALANLLVNKAVND